jgi:hypothetical protein
MGLTYNIQEAMEWQRETEARRAGVLPKDIALSRRCGIDARDVRVFRAFSGRGFLIVVRCPNPAARAWHGLFPPKPISMKDKSGSSGVAVGRPGYMRVSDYDLMSLWRRGATGWEKVFASAANGADSGPYLPEARLLIKQLNGSLVSRIQHGCQDDYVSPKNPGVKLTDHFVAFFNNQAEYFDSPLLCQMFYKRKRLVWLYNSTGVYRLDVARHMLA